MRAVRSALVVMAIGCGSPPKPPPAHPSAKLIAASLDASMASMAEVVHRLRGRCTETAKQLIRVFADMKREIAEVRRVQLDPDQARELKLEMDAYDTTSKGRDDAIAADLTPCAHDPDIINVMTTMPEL
jgi:hypothetical protein